ncbi:hypothetical protein [Mesorhizobium sp.]|uniref:hypothetical protein n=1 Tax=Mesorhizobium sp. TaxID=1871066 RepID=UPI000FEA87BF|nr:hypothetical protein [Mesorhizobium sp.]RWC60963.1 MAG: hypothetical protein EOS56_12850 [Mesorhizobium sp.]RWC63487.1 MAG: hypothetical protein EOS29_14500 [Mesorhizobium sp.]
MSILDDDRWSSLKGGYKVAYDPRPALRTLALRYDDKTVWDELWNELHHQGDVGDASYAAVVEIVRISEGHAPAYWGAYGLVATVEEARLLDDRNPPVPAWIEPHYKAAWRTLLHLALRDLATCTDDETVNCALGVIALYRGRFNLGRMAMCTEDERADMLRDYFGR